MSEHHRSRPAINAEGVVVVAAIAALVLLAPARLDAQPQGQGRGGPPPTPQAAAPIDLTGYWVSIVTEDWLWRMITPPKGDVASVPVNAAARKVAESWDLARDVASGNQCKAFGAAGIMRIPGRLHITWQDANTLKIEINGLIAALNTILDLVIPAPTQERGTMIVPGHGRLADEHDLLEYRDMTVIIRDRIQAMIDKGMTLDQVRAARPTFEYEPRWGAQTGFWTTAMFVEAVYNSLKEDKDSSPRGERR